MKLVDAFQKSWKKSITEQNTNLNSLSLFAHHLIKKHQVYSLGKRNSKELYNILILGSHKKSTSQRYFEAFFESSTTDWKVIYLLPRKTTIDTKYCSFQYKTLNNVLYLNKLLFKFRKVKYPLCSFYKSAEETIIHLFSESLCTQYIWNQTQIFFSGYVTIPDVTLQSVILSFTDTSTEHFLLINHLLLSYLYKARDSQNLSLLASKNNIIKLKL